jgi:post-segregation antitoxin (ccd killing protein)
MPIITTQDGRTFTRITVNVETGLKTKAKEAGVNFTKIFTDALIAELEKGVYD